MVEGMKCRLVLEERVKGAYSPDASGNNFLYQLLGAEQVKVVPGGSDMMAEMQAVADEVATVKGPARAKPKAAKVKRLAEPKATAGGVTADVPLFGPTPMATMEPAPLGPAPEAARDDGPPAASKTKPRP